MYSDYLVAPSGDSPCLFGVKSDGVTLIGPLLGWPISPMTWASPNGWLASVATDLDQQAHVFVARVPEDINTLQSLHIPRPYRATKHAQDVLNIKALLIDEDRLFVGGGSWSGPWLAWIDLTSPASIWTFIDIKEGSPHTTWSDKAIDALGISGTLIVAFDNLYTPLFAFLVPRLGPSREFSSEGPARAIRLKTHSTYETIVACATGPSFGAHLSTSINHGATTEFVSIWTHTFSGEELAVFARSDRDWDRRVDAFGRAGLRPPRPDWRHLCIVGNKLVIAAGEAGVGIWDFGTRTELVYRIDIGPVDLVFSSEVLPNNVLICTRVPNGWRHALVGVSMTSATNTLPGRFAFASSLMLDGTEGLPEDLSEKWIDAFRGELIFRRDCLVQLIEDTRVKLLELMSQPSTDEKPIGDTSHRLSEFYRSLGVILVALWKVESGRYGCCEICGTFLGTGNLLDDPSLATCGKCLDATKRTDPQENSEPSPAPTPISDVEPIAVGGGGDHIQFTPDVQSALGDRPEAALPKRSRVVGKIVGLAIAASIVGLSIQSKNDRDRVREAVRVSRERAEQPIRQQVVDLARDYRADPNWLKSLSNGEDYRLQPVLTYELERAWIANGPILFIGSIKDIALVDGNYYRVTLRLGFNTMNAIFATELTLSLRMDKRLLDTFMKSHPDLLKEDGFNNSVAVAAKIDAIESREYAGPDEMKEVKTGVGELLGIVYLGDLLL